MALVFGCTASTPSVPIDSGPDEVDAVYRMCGLAASCPGGPQSVLSAIDSCTKVVLTARATVAAPNQPLFGVMGVNELLACAAKSKTCADWLECTSAPHGPSYCAKHVGDSCDGNTAVSCASASAAGVVLDCPSAYPCTLTGGKARCSDGTSCSPDNDYLGQCAGNALVSCVCADGSITCNAGTGTQYATPCAPGTCGFTGGPPGPTYAACLAPAVFPPCNVPTTTSSCKGDVFDDCEARGNESEFDCASAEAHCDANAANPYFSHCVSNATECDDHADVASCDGNALRWCIDGKWREFDCTPIGMQCDLHGDPANCVAN
jgi:hypothetical protein